MFFRLRYYIGIATITINDVKFLCHPVTKEAYLDITLRCRPSVKDFSGLQQYLLHHLLIRE